MIHGQHTFTHRNMHMRRNHDDAARTRRGELENKHKKMENRKRKEGREDVLGVRKVKM